MFKRNKKNRSKKVRSSSSGGFWAGVGEFVSDIFLFWD